MCNRVDWKVATAKAAHEVSSSLILAGLNDGLGSIIASENRQGMHAGPHACAVKEEGKSVTSASKQPFQALRGTDHRNAKPYKPIIARQ